MGESLRTVWIKPDNDEWAVKFPYDPGLVNSIKNMIHPADREWDRESKTWWVSDGQDFDDWCAWLKGRGFSVKISGGGEYSPGVRPTEGSTWADTVLAAVGEARRDAVFRALTRVLHPDNPDTGDATLMQQLILARESVPQ